MDNNLSMRIKNTQSVIQIMVDISCLPEHAVHLKKMAMARRAKQQFQSIGEEFGLACVICREGYMFPPGKLRAIYTGARLWEEAEQKTRRNNLEHIRCLLHQCVEGEQLRLLPGLMGGLVTWRAGGCLTSSQPASTASSLGLVTWRAW